MKIMLFNDIYLIFLFRGNYVYPGGGLPRMHYLDEGYSNSRHILGRQGSYINY